MVLDRRADLGTAAFQHYLDLQAGLARRRKAALRAAAQASRDLADAEAKEEAARWQPLESAFPPAHFVRLVLPSGPARNKRLTAQRRESYARHLASIIAEAISHPSSPAVAGPPEASPDPWSGRLCAQCGGGCCTRGGDTAYLSADTMRRVLADRPSWSAGLLLSAYLEALGARSRSDSCINHGADGCRLPRELRADICNDFACPALSELQERAQRQPALQGVIVIQRRQDHWRRGTPGLDNGIVGQFLLKPAGGDAAAE
jgi:hypothetical protein